MAMKEFLYPSNWTENMESYRVNKEHIINKIVDYMENYKKYVPAVIKQKQKLKEQFFSGAKLYGAVSHG